MIKKNYVEFIKYGKTRQAVTSDLGKQASRRVGTRWGGRWVDGAFDNKKPQNFFAYKKRKENRKNPEKLVYHYPTGYRKTWKSYGK